MPLDTKTSHSDRKRSIDCSAAAKRKIICKSMLFDTMTDCHQSSFVSLWCAFVVRFDDLINTTATDHQFRFVGILICRRHKISILMWQHIKRHTKNIVSVSPVCLVFLFLASFVAVFVRSRFICCLLSHHNFSQREIKFTSTTCGLTSNTTKP